MTIEHAGKNSMFPGPALFLMLGLLFLPLIACNGEPQSTAHSITATRPASATPASPDLHRQANFLLSLPFTFSHVSGGVRDDDGTVVPLDDNTIKAQITTELKHLLFVVDKNANLQVYSSGTTPTKVQTTLNAQGSTAINYKQTVDSEAGSITILFAGTLSRENISVTYEQQYSPSMLINASPSDVIVTFSTHVRWIPISEIPAAPANGHDRVTSKGGVVLSWTVGQHAAAYNVYRLISDLNQQFQLIATVNGTAYQDDSVEARQHIHTTKGITYAIFSVGPTGVENPGGIILSVSA